MLQVAPTALKPGALGNSVTGHTMISRLSGEVGRVIGSALRIGRPEEVGKVLKTELRNRYRDIYAIGKTG